MPNKIILEDGTEVEFSNPLNVSGSTVAEFFNALQQSKNQSDNDTPQSSQRDI